MKHQPTPSDSPHSSRSCPGSSPGGANRAVFVDLPEYERLVRENEDLGRLVERMKSQLAKALEKIAELHTLLKGAASHGR